MASHYPAAGGDLREDLEMHAFPLPNGVPRRAVRDAVIARLAAAGELSPLYFGFRPVVADESVDVAAAADAIVAGLGANLRRSV